MYAGNLGELRELVFILKELCNDEEMMQYVYNRDTEDPTHVALPVDKTGYDLLMYENVFPYLKIIDLDEDVNIYLCVYFGKSINSGGTADYKDNLLFVDVYVHQSLWKIDSGIRTNEILIRIDTLLNDKKIENVTEPFSYVSLRALPSPNPRYAGFGLMYHKVDSGTKNRYE